MKNRFNISFILLKYSLEYLESFWVSYINAVESDEEKEQRLLILQDIVKKAFGKPIKLSTVVPSQQDLLEWVLNEFHNL